MAKKRDFSELFNREKPMLEVRELKKLYPQKNGKLLSFHAPRKVHAVDGVSFTLNEKEIFGIIGESGCGKSTLGRLLIRLEEPTSGEIEFYGVSTKKLLDCNPEQFHCLVQSVFQNPFDTFTPNDTIGAIMERPLKLHHIGETDEERRKICVDALNEGGLIPAESFLERYPHELSGGQLQRISILRSMLLKPKFLVVDEPVSMLDVSVRADIINMLLKLVENHNTSILFISHDISIIRYVSARVAVMYLGNIVEMGETDTIIHHPLHPYTQALISNCASIDLDEKRDPHRGRAAVSCGPQALLPVCRALLLRAGNLPAREAAAQAHGGRPRGGLSSGEGKIVREQQALFPAG
mgnify:CR=1 FL=1